MTDAFSTAQENCISKALPNVSLFIFRDTPTPALHFKSTSLKMKCKKNCNSKQKTRLKETSSILCHMNSLQQGYSEIEEYSWNKLANKDLIFHKI